MSRITLLANARLADDSLVDISIGAEGPTTDGEPSTAVLDIVQAGGSGSGQLAADRQMTDVRDMAGYVVLPRLREPHAHLDKALSADEVDNPTGDLGGAIRAWLDHRISITHDDYVQRALAAVDLYERNGVRLLRSHVDLGSDVGSRGLEALLEVKEKVAERVHIQLVGLPVGLSGENADNVIAVCRRALDLGLDMMGGVPHIEDDPARAIDVILDLAGSHGRGVDIHADENLHPDSSDLATLAGAIIRTGFEYPATASHCVALSMKSPEDQTHVAALAAEAQVTVVALPHTNLFLQARDHASAPPRGLAPVAALAELGVTVQAGGDNLQDPFNPLGSGDPLETAALMVLAGHVTVIDAVAMVSATGRPIPGKGDRAELMAIPGRSVREVMATRPAERLLLKFDV